MRDALAAKVRVTDLFVRADDTDAITLGEECAALGVDVFEVGENVLRLLGDTATSQGAVAVCQMPVFGVDELSATSDLVLLLDRVRDPGNAGTLVRSAAAAGADCVVFGEGSVDPFGPKTVRASAGSVFRVPIARDVLISDAIQTLRARGFESVAADGRAESSIFETDLTGRAAIVLGNEAWGFGDGGVAADRSASIPLARGIESLNVGTAGSIFLFEAVRQRRLSSSSDG